MNQNKLYLLLGGATAAGYAYLAWAFLKHEDQSSFTPCVIKNVTGLPCPSCGSTRSVISISHGEVVQAAMINPFGIIIAAVMVAVPLWLLYDVMLKKDTLYVNYAALEQKLKIKWVAILLMALVLANWIWNINKGL